MKRIQKGDDVIVIAGKDKGRRGNVAQVLDNGKVLVENVNLVKKHQKPNPNAGEPGGIKEIEAALDISNVMLFNASTGKGDRVGIKTLDDGRRVRFFKSNGDFVDS